VRGESGKESKGRTDLSRGWTLAGASPSSADFFFRFFGASVERVATVSSLRTLGGGLAAAEAPASSGDRDAFFFGVNATELCVVLIFLFVLTPSSSDMAGWGGDTLVSDLVTR